MTTDVHETLRQRLNEALAAHPDSLAVISRRAGYNANYIGSLTGRRQRRNSNPTIGAVWAIAGAMGVDPLWLLGN